MEMESVLNDNVIIPKAIMSMSKEQMQKEIQRLEKESAEKKAEIIAAKQR
ncbi:MAG: hypothetical protein QM689_04430 [Oscillospiraceae bacterium]